MFKPLLGQKIAFLVGNGFNERDLTEAQRALQKEGANVRIVSMDHGLVNSWNENAWGLHFAADQVLSEALAADFSLLVVPGGQRSVEKLKLTAHTRRFLRGFVETGKRVALMGDATDLLIFADLAAGYTLSAPGNLKSAIEAAGAKAVAAPFHEDRNVLSGVCDTPAAAASFAAKIVQFFSEQEHVQEAA